MLLLGDTAWIYQLGTRGVLCDAKSHRSRRGLDFHGFTLTWPSPTLAAAFSFFSTNKCKSSSRLTLLVEAIYIFVNCCWSIGFKIIEKMPFSWNNSTQVIWICTLQPAAREKFGFCSNLVLCLLKHSLPILLLLLLLKLAPFAFTRLRYSSIVRSPERSGSFFNPISW